MKATPDRRMVWACRQPLWQAFSDRPCKATVFDVRPVDPADLVFPCDACGARNPWFTLRKFLMKCKLARLLLV